MKQFSLSDFLVVVSLIGVGCALFATDGCKAQKLRSAAEVAAKERRAKIAVEVGQLSEPEWAGDYYYGDGLGVNVSLSLAPESGFVFEWHGCLGLYDRNLGPVEFADGLVKLRPQFPNSRRGFQGIATELLPIHWGNRHYLVPPNDLIDFCNAVNAQSVEGRFLLKEGHEQLKVSGMPDVPSHYQRFLLEKPITASVTEAGESLTRPTVTHGQTSRVTLDVGKTSGILPGMEFYVIDPDDSMGSAIIDEVQQDSSTAKFTSFFEEDPPPAVGWKFSTCPRWAKDESTEVGEEEP